MTINTLKQRVLSGTSMKSCKDRLAHDLAKWIEFQALSDEYKIIKEAFDETMRSTLAEAGRYMYSVMKAESTHG